MLVLSRKESERIRLGDSIVVTVVRVAGDKVRLGIEAPADMLVLREELEPHSRVASIRPSPSEVAVQMRRDDRECA
jgi:carbon storage regulator